MRGLTSIALAYLLLMSAVGTYQLLATYAPNLDTSLWTLAILFGPLGSLAVVLNALGQIAGLSHRGHP
jgi:hypothetical protein